MMKDKVVHIKTKNKQFNTCVLPVFTYRNKTWALTRNTLRKLSKCQYVIDGSMIEIKEINRKGNISSFQKTNDQDMTSRLRMQK